MRKIRIAGDCLKAFPLSPYTRVWFAVLFLLMDAAASPAAEKAAEKIAVFPTDALRGLYHL